MASALFLALLASQILSVPSKAGDISVTVINGQGQFLLAGSVFIPRGVNYDITGYDQSSQADGYHGTFDPCTDGRTYPVCYGDGSQAEDNLRYIHGSQSGSVYSYNYVRAFINSVYVNNGFTYSAGSGVVQLNTIPGEWLSNLADFLQRAKNNGLRVILTGEYAPKNFPNDKLVCSDPSRPDLISPCSPSENDVIFNPDYGDALGRFDAAIIAELNSSTYAATWPSAASAIMAIDMKNEAKVRSDLLPLSDHSLTKLHIDNGTYDMSDRSSRQNLIDDLTKNFVLSVGRAIRSADPSHSILVGASVTTPTAVRHAGYNGAFGPTSCDASNQPACTFPLRWDIMALYGGVDFRDIHSYPFAAGYDEVQDLQSAGLVYGQANPVPLIMGEFGALRQSISNPSGVYPDEQNAVRALRQHMTTSCAYGFGGWGLWSWMPTNPAAGDLFWTAIFYNPDGTENNGVNGGLAIQAWPNVCP
jgi:hypothetical protein